MSKVSICGNAQNDGIRVKTLSQRIKTVALWVMATLIAVFITILVVITAELARYLNTPLIFVLFVAIVGLAVVIISK